MRYVVYGAGAVGGVLGAYLLLAGHEVVLVARGAHYEQMARSGLTVRTPLGAHTVKPEVVSAPSRISWAPDDVVLLTVKSQDTLAALDALHEVAGPGVPVVCCQNGVSNERVAAERFSRVYGMFVMILATHLDPGIVVVHAAPVAGVFDLGLYPRGADGLAVRIASDLERASLRSAVRQDVMAWKRAKLLTNLANVVNAACGPRAPALGIVESAREEGIAVFAAAGLPVARAEELRARFAESSAYGPVDGVERVGGSTWQSLAKGAPLEVEHLNGEIVRLGRLHGVPTPANEGLLRVAACLSAEHRAAGSMTAEELLAIAGSASSPSFGEPPR